MLPNVKKPYKRKRSIAIWAVKKHPKFGNVWGSDSYCRNGEVLIRRFIIGKRHTRPSRRMTMAKYAFIRGSKYHRYMSEEWGKTTSTSRKKEGFKLIRCHKDNIDYGKPSPWHKGRFDE